MIQEKINKGITSVRKIKMSAQEESLFRVNLTTYVNKTSQEGEILGVPTPVEVLPLRSFYFNLSSFKPQLAYAAFSILGLFFIAAGTVSAAKSSLPGDLLYPIKIKIVEPTLGLLTFTPIAKANFEAKKAENRLEEVEALVRKNNLNKNNGEELKKNFENHTKAFNGFVEDVETKNVIGAVKIREDFENKIDKHSRIFEKINEDSQKVKKDEDIKKNEQNEEIKKFNDVLKNKVIQFKERESSSQNDSLQKIDDEYDVSKNKRTGNDK